MPAFKKLLQEVRSQVRDPKTQKYLLILLQEITARLHKANPGVFVGVEMGNHRNMTIYVENSAPSGQLDNTIEVMQAAFYVTRQIFKMYDGLGAMVAVYHTEGTAWYFQFRAASATVIGNQSEVCRAMLCPLILFAPNYNEITVGPQFVMQPDCPEVLTQFEDQFRGFLANTVLCEPGSIMTVTCGACNAETTGLVTACRKCKTRMCDNCVRAGNCPCGTVPPPVQVPRNATLAEVSAAISASNMTETRPPESVFFMPTGL